MRLGFRPLSTLMALSVGSMLLGLTHFPVQATGAAPVQVTHQVSSASGS